MVRDPRQSFRERNGGGGSGNIDATRRPSHGMLIGALVLFVLGALSLVYGNPSRNFETELTWTSIGVAAVCWSAAAFVAALVPRTFRQLRLALWILVYSGVTFGLATVTAVKAPNTLSYQIDLYSLPAAQRGFLQAICAFALGYLVFGRGILGRRIQALGNSVERWRASRHFTQARGFLAYAVGLAALVGGALISGSFGYLGNNIVETAAEASAATQPLAIVAALRGYVLIAFWLQVFSYKRVSGVFALAVALTAVDFGAGLLSGTKEAPVVTMLAPILAYIYQRRRVPVVALGVGVFTFFSLLAPFVQTLRGIVRGGSSLPLYDALSQAVGLLGEGTSSMVVGSGWEHLARLRLVDNLALVMAKSPDIIPYQPIRNLVYGPATGFIPRAIWPGKPVRVEGLVFYQEYYGGTVHNSSALTVPGSLYMHGGIMVLFAGMIALGALVRIIDDLPSGGALVSGLFLLFCLFPSFVKFEASVVTLLASLPIHIISWLLALAIIYHSRRGSDHRADVGGTLKPSGGGQHLADPGVA